MKLRNMTSLYLVDGNRVLCLYRVGSKVVKNKFIGSAGGHFEENELNDPERCVLRELKEELGLTKDDITDFRLRYITHRLMEGEIRQNYYFFAGLKVNRELKSSEGTLRWVVFSEIPDLPMPISAKHMILHYLKTGRFDEELYAGITEEHGTNFVSMKQFS